MDEWIYFLKNEEVKDEFKAKGLQKAKKAFSIRCLPEKDRLAFARYQDDLRYQASLIESNYGLGLLEGREEGREERLARGIEKRNLEIALEMINGGESNGKIGKYTGLTDEKIDEFRKGK